MLQCKINQGEAPVQRRSWGRITVVGMFVATSVLLAGCESIPDSVNPVKWFEDEPPEATAQPGAGDKEFPNLGAVPERPVVPSLKSQQAEIREGLVADQENARYTEEVVRQEVDRRAGVPTQATGPRVSAVPPAPPPVARPVVARPTIPSAPASTVAPVSRPGVPAPPSVPVPVPQAAAPAEPRVAVAVPNVPTPAPPPPAAPTVRTVVPPAPTVVPPPTPTLTPTPAPAPSTVAAAPLLTAPVKVGTIYFAENARQLQSADVAILEQIAAAQRATGKRLRVAGYASGGAIPSGSARQSKANYQVSLARAKAVVSALVSLGVPSQKIYVEALGDTAPLYAEYTAAGEAANRRAEIWMMD